MISGNGKVMGKKFYSASDVNNSMIAKHKKIIPVELTKKVKEGIVGKVENVPVVRSNGMNTSFTIFHLQETANRFGLEYDTILLVLYLQEVVYFSWRLEIIDRGVNLRLLVDLGLVEKYEGKLYKLTKFGNQVANFFNQTSDNKYLGVNREVEVDNSDFNVKDALSGFFD